MRLLIYILAIAIFSLLLLAGRPADAHSQSYSYVDLDLRGAMAEGRFQAAVRDLDRVSHLDSNGDGSITWGEVRAREGVIATTALQTIILRSASGHCSLTPQPVLIDSHGGESYIVMPFTSDCKVGIPLTLGYSFLSGLDAQHRGLVSVADAGGKVSNFVIAAGQAAISLKTDDPNLIAEAASFVAHGFHHILIGYDHILFVLTLLIGVAMQRRGRPIRETFFQTAKVVTAFTLSHSVTLALAALGWLSVPTALAESLIAATIAIAALNNIWPLLTARLWLVALLFGLIHGVGFASVLAQIGLPQDNLLLTLLSFNIGVEAGQLAVVAVALPAIVLVARQPLSRVAMPLGNLAITLLALIWLSDRSLGTAMMPF